MLEEMVKTGRLGRKSGKGFYDVSNSDVRSLSLADPDSTKVKRDRQIFPENPIGTLVVLHTVYTTWTLVSIDGS